MSYIQSAIVERTIATLRRAVARYMTTNKTKTFIDAWPGVVRNYNMTVHGSTKFTPLDGLEMKNQSQIFDNLFKDLIGKRPKKLEFIHGMKVRISSSKLTFDKASQTEAWTREIFTVEAFQSYPSNYFTLKDATGEKIIGMPKTHLCCIYIKLHVPICMYIYYLYLGSSYPSELSLVPKKGRKQ
jgi:hypothetical protein